MCLDNKCLTFTVLPFNTHLGSLHLSKRLHLKLPFTKQTPKDYTDIMSEKHLYITLQKLC